MPLRAENGFLPDLDAIPEDVAQKAKLLILNLPGNPFQQCQTCAFFEKVVAFAKRYNIIVLHDAAYSEYYFTGDSPISFLSTPGAMEVGMEINSLSKSFSLAGARIAYIVGNAEIIRIIKTIQIEFGLWYVWTDSGSGCKALDNAEEITDRLRVEFSARHNVLMKG